MCGSTYESASLRMFKYGRTDAIRSTTMDLSKFVLAMDDPDKRVGRSNAIALSTWIFRPRPVPFLDPLSPASPQNTEKIALMRQAVQTHRQTTKEVRPWPDANVHVPSH